MLPVYPPIENATAGAACVAVHRGAASGADVARTVISVRHAAHARLVALPRVRPHLVPLAARRRVHDHERRRVRVHPDVAGEVAHVGPEVGEVAQRRLLLLLRWPLLEPHLTIPNLLRRLCTRYKPQHHITHAAVMDLGSPVHGVLV
jgi:hypothetical protein